MRLSAELAVSQEDLREPIGKRAARRLTKGKGHLKRPEAAAKRKGDVSKVKGTGNRIQHRLGHRQTSFKAGCETGRVLPILYLEGRTAS